VVTSYSFCLAGILLQIISRGVLQLSFGLC
jgi:hypothetical protein